MKKVSLILSFMLLSIGLLGCQQNNEVKNDTSAKSNEIKESQALDETIKFHNNSTDESNIDNNFPTTINSRETISKEVEIGGKYGSASTVDMSAKLEKSEDSFIVTLTKNYNVMVGEKEAISYWKYEVSNSEVKLVDKKEDGKLVNLMK